MSPIFKDAVLLSREIGSLRSGKKIVFTNGCFDIIHEGHIHILKEAAALGDILVVGMNSDESVKMLKGPHRPVFDQARRSLILEAVRYVDYVILFDEETPMELIKIIRPDILVKGAEYAEEKIVGRDFAGELARIPMIKGSSTSAIIERIQKLAR
jgi:D-beta-D-heptose 7-phosphate kinase/D-beta-D-heptose 1-phosphate adenosyltransferase